MPIIPLKKCKQFDNKENELMAQIVSYKNYQLKSIDMNNTKLIQKLVILFIRPTD